MTQELTKSLILLDELLNSKSKEELYQEILKYEDKNINSPTLKEYLDYIICHDNRSAITIKP